MLNQPKHSSTVKWIKTWYIYTILVMKKNKIMPFSETWIDLETFIKTEVHQKEKNFM